MPNLEDQLHRYGDLLDADAGSRHPVGSTPAPRRRHAIGAALAAVAVVVVVSLIAVALGTRSTREPSPATGGAIAPTTSAAITPHRTTPAAWIRKLGGRVVDVGPGPDRLNAVSDVVMSADAIYTVSVGDAGTERETLSRIDRRTLHVVSGGPAATAERVFVSGNALYVAAGIHDAPSAWSLQRLDPDTLRPLWTTPLPGADATFDDPRIVADSHFVTVATGHDLDQFDAESGHLLRSDNLTLPTSHTGAFLALDPSDQTLYVVFADGRGNPQPVQRRDPQTGKQPPLDPAFNPNGTSGIAAPVVVATDTGVWIVDRKRSSETPPEGIAASTTVSFFRKYDLKRTGMLTLAPGSVEVAVVGPTLWIRSPHSITCGAAASVAGGSRFFSGGAHLPTSLPLYGFAADASSVVLSVDGTVGIFTPHQLCPNAK